MIESSDFETAEMFEGFESESGEGESWERRGGRRFPTPPRATGKGLFTPRPTTNYVTQVQLQTALAKTGASIKTNSDAITVVNTRLNTVSAEQARVAAALKKEAEERKKESDTQKKDVNQKVQLLALLPLLVKPSSKAITAAGQGLAEGDKVLVESGSTLNSILPLLLISGLGGSGGLGGGSGSEGGMDTSMLLVLALVMGQQNQK